MEGNRTSFSKKRPNPQFTNKAGPKKGKWQNSGNETSNEDFSASDTFFRILCYSRKIGSVIGKGGGIIRALREETQAKITVADSVPGSDERVIIIFSPSTKPARRQNADDENEDLDAQKDDGVIPHCAAQDALLKVHDRIVEEDIVGGENNNGNEIMVTARLLVPINMVGCVLGRKGDVIQRLRSDTGASIRVLPAEHLPSCAMDTDELVQISGKPAIAKKALYEVSTLLHQNPRKDKPPSRFPLAYGSHNFKPTGHPIPNILPPGNSTWAHCNPNEHDMPIPWVDRYRNPPPGLPPNDFDDLPPRGGEVQSEFSMKILCSASKIGGVIGKGGFHVKQLQQDTGASIQVENVNSESDERVIRVSSLEVLWNPRSSTIEAILHLQDRTSEYSEKGTIITRLLVPSSKVGCILGQGGHVINEMRRRTQADIRVFSKEDKPKCASEDEELVQISGNFRVAKDALAEIASRLRTRCLRDANTKGEPAPTRPVPGFIPSGNLTGGGPPPYAAPGSGSSGRYDHHKGDANEYESPRYPVPPSGMGYPTISRNRGAPNDIVGPNMGAGGSNIGEVVGARMKLQDHQSIGAERFLDIRRSSEHLNAGQNMFQMFGSASARYNNPERDPYQSYTSQHSVYNNSERVPYQSYGSQQGVFGSTNPSQRPNQSFNSPHAPYQNINSQQAPYQNISTPGSFHY